MKELKQGKDGTSLSLRDSLSSPCPLAPRVGCRLVVFVINTHGVCFGYLGSYWPRQAILGLGAKAVSACFSPGIAMASATTPAAAGSGPQREELAAGSTASPSAPETIDVKPSINSKALPRPSSYILVSNSARALSDYDDNDEDDNDDPDDPTSVPSGDNTSDQVRPKYFFILPALAALDLAIICFVGFTVLGEERERQDGSMALTGTIMASAALRDSVFAIAGVSKNIRNLGITVAAVSLVSTCGSTVLAKAAAHPALLAVIDALYHLGVQPHFPSPRSGTR